MGAILSELFAGFPVVAVEVGLDAVGTDGDRDEGNARGGIGPASLFDEERAQLLRAVPKRVREFAAGRWCARQALTRLGRGPVPLPSLPDRTPRWPDGFTGSITHTKGFAAAAVARTSDVCGVGIDAEQCSPLGDELLDHICTEAERTWLDTRAPSERGVLAKLIFSAKECGYKCQYASSQTFLGFHAMRIAPDPERGTFVAEFLQPAGEAFAVGDRLEGRFAITEHWIVSAMCLEARYGDT